MATPLTENLEQNWTDTHTHIMLSIRPRIFEFTIDNRAFCRGEQCNTAVMMVDTEIIAKGDQSSVVVQNLAPSVHTTLPLFLRETTTKPSPDIFTNASDNLAYNSSSTRIIVVFIRVHLLWLYSQSSMILIECSQ